MSTILQMAPSDEGIRKLLASVIVGAKPSLRSKRGIGLNDLEILNMLHDIISNLSRSEVEGEIASSPLKRLSPSTANDDVLTDQMANLSLYEYVQDLVENVLENSGVAAPSSSLLTLIKQSMVLDKDRILCANEKPPLGCKHLDNDNSRTTPFKPKLKIKYHATSPLQLIEMPLEDESVSKEDRLVSPATYYPHPYEHELRRLAYSEQQILPPSLSTVFPTLAIVASSRKGEGQRGSDGPSTFVSPCIWVDTLQGLADMITELGKGSEVALDVEHSSIRNAFQGLVSVLQLSSRTSDYVIDALALRNDLHLLGKVLSDPQIVKVTHDCEKDVLWLQRDFGLYVVNCFDTCIAARALRYPLCSHAHLVRYHCGKTLSMRNQSVDWWQRPLPEPSLQLARDDTTHLLRIYDALRQDLWKTQGKQGLENVLDSSRKVCLARYEKPRFRSRGYRSLLSQLHRCFGPSSGKFDKGSGTESTCALYPLDLSLRQDEAMAALWNWRDALARDLDCGSDSVLPPSLLLRIGLQTPLDQAQLLACFEQHLEAGFNPLEGLVERNQGAGSDGRHPVSASSLMEAIVSLMLQAHQSSSSAPPSSTKKNGLTKLPSSHHQPALVSPSPKGGDQHPPPYKSRHMPSPGPSVYTFTPAELLSPHQHGSSSASPSLFDGGHFRGIASANASQQSPVMGVEEIFRLAGWSTPLNTGLGGAATSIGGTYKGSGNGGCMSPTREEEELLQNPRLRGSTLSLMEQRTLLVTDPLEEGEEGSETEAIPSSYEEIYQISLRNRQRNKDKKKGGKEGATDDYALDCGHELSAENTSSFISLPAPPFDSGYLPSSTQSLVERSSLHVQVPVPLAIETLSLAEATLPSVASSPLSYKPYSFDHYAYFAREETDVGVEGTLAFATELGWLNSEAHNREVKEKYEAYDKVQR